MAEISSILRGAEGCRKFFPAFYEEETDRVRTKGSH